MLPLFTGDLVSRKLALCGSLEGYAQIIIQSNWEADIRSG